MLLDGILRDASGAVEAFDFAGRSEEQWRVERRFYTKKNGDIMLYWNYRSRRPIYRSDGSRVIPYRKGGKKLWRRAANTN